MTPLSPRSTLPRNPARASKDFSKRLAFWSERRQGVLRALHVRGESKRSVPLTAHHEGLIADHLGMTWPCFNAPRVRGLAHTAIRSSSAACAPLLGRTLEPRAPTHGPQSWRA